VDGSTRDLRLPLAEGEKVQFLTTRDTDDPDALYVLRHSTAHLLAEAVMRLHPGVKIAIGPPIADGFYYDFEFPEPISEADLQAIEDEIRREIAEGRVWTREELSREDAIARFEAESQPYKVELARDAEGTISVYTQGDFTDLCRGPHLQNAEPIKAVKLTSLAGATGAGTSTTRSSPASTARRSTPRPTSMPTSSASSRRGRTTTAGWGCSSTSSTSTSTRPVRLSGTRRGWCCGTRSRTCVGARTGGAATSR
jgi:threonyl-tRNA synthetase